MTSLTGKPVHRRLPIGAEVLPEGGVHFRVWAPCRRRVSVEFAPSAAGPAPLGPLPLAPEPEGYFSGHAPGAAAGARYAFRLDDDEKLYPDPASRFQPDGVHGHSEVVDARAFRWTDEGWQGAPLRGQVMYELHVGTFTPAGTWRGAIERLPFLADLGITSVEIMPVAEFAGEFGWGYDGVDLFAPTRLYGTPDDFRAFVNAAHQVGLGVLLDVVYNHFGPVGNYLAQFSRDYLSRQHHTAWGDAINFDGENSSGVREFIVANAGYWIDEFHVDGLRLDAVHAIVDDSPDHILAELTRHVRRVAGPRRTLIVAENELQQARLLRPAERGGYGLDAAWSDDLHHAARVALSGHAEYYYGDYRGSPQELISSVKWGFLYQGQWNHRQRRARGTSALDLAAEQFVTFLQNHDQVGNSPRGMRMHQLTSPGRHRALTALWLLAPGTPLFFQGQEFEAGRPFLFFADHEPSLGKLVREGRQADMFHFRRLAGEDAAEWFDDPCDRGTFEKSRLDWGDAERNAAALALHRDLLRLRREDRVFAAQRSDRIHGALLADEAFLLRYLGDSGDDRLLVINLGRDLDGRPAAEPLLAPPDGTRWRLLWSSEDPRYGGLGTRPLDVEGWYFPGHAAAVLCPDNA